MWLNSSEGAAKGTSRVPLVPVPDLSQFDPEYSTADLERAESWGFREQGPESGWRRNKKVATPPAEQGVEPVTKWPGPLTMEGTH